MICPYNNFKTMDCEKCAAWMEIAVLACPEQPVNVYSTPLPKCCALAYRGASAAQKPLIMLQNEQPPMI